MLRNRPSTPAPSNAGPFANFWRYDRASESGVRLMPGPVNVRKGFAMDATHMYFVVARDELDWSKPAGITRIRMPEPDAMARLQ